MKKVVVTKYGGAGFDHTKIEIFRNGEREKAIVVNRFYDYEDDFIKVYETLGGSGGLSKGKLLHSISIKDCEFETKTSSDRSDVYN